MDPSAELNTFFQELRPRFDEIDYLTLHHADPEDKSRIDAWNWPAAAPEAAFDATTWCLDTATQTDLGRGGAFRVAAWGVKGESRISQRTFRLARSGEATAIEAAEAPDLQGMNDALMPLVLKLSMRIAAASMEREERAAGHWERLMHEQRQSYQELQRETIANMREMRERLKESDKNLRSAHSTIAQMREQELADKADALLEATKDIAPQEQGWISDAVAKLDDWLTLFVSDAKGIPAELISLIRDEPALVERLRDPRVRALASDRSKLDMLFSMLDAIEP